MKKLFVTNRIPNGATILLVDLEESYFEEVLECEELERQRILNERISTRLSVMKQTLIQLKEAGHKILAITADNIYKGFESIPDEYLPRWDYERVEQDGYYDLGYSYILNPAIVERIRQESKVIVCGLWKELCVYIVSRKLQQQYEHNVLMYYGSDLTLENGMMWLDDDVITLDEVCLQDGVVIEEINE